MFSITHSDFNQKIITRNLDILIITRPHIFLSAVHLKVAVVFWVLILFIGRWLVDRPSLHLAGWSVVCGWLVGL